MSEFIRGSHDLARRLLELPDLDVAVSDKPKFEKPYNAVTFHRVMYAPEERQVSYLWDDSTDHVIVIWRDDNW